MGVVGSGSSHNVQLEAGIPGGKSADRRDWFR